MTTCRFYARGKAYIRNHTELTCDCVKAGKHISVPVNTSGRLEFLNATHLRLSAVVLALTPRLRAACLRKVVVLLVVPDIRGYERPIRPLGLRARVRQRRH